jgi:hypothetical protein
MVLIPFLVLFFSGVVIFLIVRELQEQRCEKNRPKRRGVALSGRPKKPWNRHLVKPPPLPRKKGVRGSRENLKGQ